MMRKMINSLIQKLIIKLGVKLQQYQNQIARASLPKFANEPKDLMIELPRRIIQPERMFIGDNVSLGPGSFLIAATHYPSKTMQNFENSIPVQSFNAKISIGNRVTSTADLQIAAQSEIVIEDDVMFASNIHINDGVHGYETADVAYKYQKISKVAPITIKKGCWIGQNVMIMPGVTIGEFTIIGANSIVKESIPAKCIAAGNPAKVVKRWDERTENWI
ncbi:MAG: acyltransferase [Desulfobacteraceae bacterium]|nr:MAG: acyltransferase [Desulfobacteraceae bacterium]